MAENINAQIKEIEYKLLNKYSLYHNDLLEKNICIDNNNKVRIIDLESVQSNTSSLWQPWPLFQEWAKATRDKRKKEKKEKKRKKG